MRRIKFINPSWFGISILVSVLCTAQTFAEDFVPSTVFADRCSGCHTVGHDVLVGPDLKDVMSRRDQEWLLKFIGSSQTLIKSGDKTATELFKKFNQVEMPDHEFSRDEKIALLKWIQAGGPDADVANAFKAGRTAAPEVVEMGENLFGGQKRLTNGGPACISCHSAGTAGMFGGGTLGLDLTEAFSKFTDKGLDAALTNKTFVTMGLTYSGKDLTPDEIYSLRAYLSNVERSSDGPRNIGAMPFLSLGVLGSCWILGMGHMVWRRRRVASAGRN